MRVLQVSDTHFGTEQAPVVEALVRLAHALRPQLLVLSGDITQRATRAQFAAARAFVDRLEVPRHVVIPGNHDIPLGQLWWRLLAPYAHMRRQFGHALEHEVDTPELLLLALKTTRRYRHVDGELSRWQIERVAQRLARADARQLRLVVTHQPVAVMRAADAHDRLHGHRAAVHRWAEAGADLVLGGHIHLPSLIPLHEQEPSLARPMWGLQAGTAVSSRVRHEAPNSVNLIEIGFDQADSHPRPDAVRACRVERWDYAAASGKFTVVEARTLAFGNVTGTGTGAGTGTGTGR